MSIFLSFSFLSTSASLFIALKSATCMFLVFMLPLPFKVFRFGSILSLNTPLIANLVPNLPLQFFTIGAISVIELNVVATFSTSKSLMSISNLKLGTTGLVVS